MTKATASTTVEDYRAALRTLERDAKLRHERMTEHLRQLGAMGTEAAALVAALERRPTRETDVERAIAATSLAEHRNNLQQIKTATIAALREADVLAASITTLRYRLESLPDA